MKDPLRYIVHCHSVLITLRCAGLKPGLCVQPGGWPNSLRCAFSTRGAMLLLDPGLNRYGTLPT
jgi:hypothetical protein